MDFKVLIVSDSKGSVGPILTAIDREKPDAIIHLGNGVRDLVDLTFSGKIYAVRSGGEFGKKLPTASKLNYDKEIILYTHGDDWTYPKDKAKMVEFCSQQGATIVLFGGVKEPVYFEQNGIKFVSPGEMHDRTSATYAIMYLAAGQETKFEHKKLIEC